MTLGQELRPLDLPGLHIYAEVLLQVVTDCQYCVRDVLITLAERYRKPGKSFAAWIPGLREQFSRLFRIVRNPRVARVVSGNARGNDSVGSFCRPMQSQS